MTSLKIYRISSGTLVELKPNTMCWMVDIENGQVVGRKLPDMIYPPKPGFYWGGNFDWNYPGYSTRMIPRENIVGFSLGKTITLDLKSFKWSKKWKGKHILELFYTDKHGILAARANDVQTIQNTRYSQILDPVSGQFQTDINN